MRFLTCNDEGFPTIVDGADFSGKFMAKRLDDFLFL